MPVIAKDTAHWRIINTKYKVSLPAEIIGIISRQKSSYSLGWLGSSGNHNTGGSSNMFDYNRVQIWVSLC